MTIIDETTEAGTGYEVHYVALADVRDNPYNVRSEAERTRWAASIAANGIQQPIVVRELDDGTLEIEAGECRKYSALKAGITHAHVLVKKGSSSFDAARMVYVENQHRKGLDDVQAAVVVQRLLGFDGVSQRDVAKLTGLKVTDVRRAAKVASSEAAMGAAQQHGLSFDDAELLVEFEGDPEAVEQLTDAATSNPTYLPHLAARLRREREDRAAYEAVAKTVTDAGIRLIELDTGWLPDDAMWLDYLPAPKGRKTFTPAAHKSCPGHAGAVIESDDGYEVAYLCLDPVGNGHVEAVPMADPAATVTETAKPQGMTDEQKAERKRVVANNKAWPVATAVRREYLARLLGLRTAPKATLRYVTEVVLGNPHLLKEGDDATLATVLGKESQGYGWDRPVAVALVADATDARLPLVLFAQVAAAFESPHDDKTGWRRAGGDFTGYLEFLASTGYGLSDIEQELAGVEPEPIGEDAEPMAA
jgi:ParB family transcriptional regulator, chromosome partitioning protein